jgi:flagellar basal-body rod protein FlgF
MDRLIYVAMSGARAALRAQTVTSHNLANIGTTGFRAVRNTVDSVPVYGTGLPTRVNTLVQPQGWNGAQGTSVSTGRDLDVALQGAGWLAVQGADGTEGYTRDGGLRINRNGLLETTGGKLVLGNGGPIAIPPYQQMFIGGDGQISIVPEGQSPESLVQVDRLRLVNPPATELMRSEDGLFRLRDGSAAAPDLNVRIASGQLESSNVNAAQALVDMIEMSRHYEMQIRAMRTAEESDASAARLIRFG